MKGENGVQRNWRTVRILLWNSAEPLWQHQSQASDPFKNVGMATVMQPKPSFIVSQEATHSLKRRSTVYVIRGQNIHVLFHTFMCTCSWHSGKKWKFQQLMNGEVYRELAALVKTKNGCVLERKYLYTIWIMLQTLSWNSARLLQVSARSHWTLQHRRPWLKNEPRR